MRSIKVGSSPESLQPRESPATPPLWLIEAKNAIFDEIRSVGFPAGLVSSGITLGSILACVEQDELPCAWIAAHPDGALTASWCGPGDRGVMITCRDRLALVTARVGLKPDRLALADRDNRDRLIGTGDATLPLPSLRNALAWLTGSLGQSGPDLMRDAAGSGRKKIG